MFEKGFFGDFFDFNGDSKLDLFEQAADSYMLYKMVQESELENSGIEPADFELMGADEQREVLEDAGLDPDDYDFL